MARHVVALSALLRGVRSWLRCYVHFIEPYVLALLLLACVAFFLQSAGTIEIVYTIRPSFALLAMATALGIPFVWRGWACVPRWMLWSAITLVAVYALSALGNTETSLGLARAGPQRVLVYLADLCLGLATFGLVMALCRQARSRRRLLEALVVSGAFAAAYASYQWVAQRMGWPLSDVLSVQDSNALTTGGSQGIGVFGFQRVRGTFLEPHFLAMFLASSIPLAMARWLIGDDRRIRRWLGPSGFLMVAALLFTASLPAWAILLLGSSLALLAYVIVNGVRGAAAVAAAFVIMVTAIPIAIAYPSVSTGVTGRTSAELATTSSFRTQTWQDAVTIWSQRPVIGYGAGQSAVQLTAYSAGADAPGLLSPQGLWAAALIDAGVIGLGCWLLLFGGATCYGLLGFLRKPTAVHGAIAAATLVAVGSAVVAGDRVELRTWVILALLITAVLPATHQAPPTAEHTYRPDGSA